MTTEQVFSTQEIVTEHLFMNKCSVTMSEKSKHASTFMGLLQEKNKKPEDVAIALGVSPRAVFYWTSGQREPRLTIEQVQSLCTLLGCSVHDLPKDFGPKQTSADE